MKKKWVVIPAAVLAGAAALTGCGSSGGADEGAGQVYVYNWGEYIDEAVIDMFEEETGIEVIYDMFETNEEMYPVIEAGGVTYDVVCPSDYMIQKMIENDLLAEINFDNVPNISNIDPEYMERSKSFDPENKYSVPYCWGTVGILYNTTMVQEPVTSWDILWDETYADQILMYDSIRDTIGVALMKLGYSINTRNEADIQAAEEALIALVHLRAVGGIDQLIDWDKKDPAIDLMRYMDDAVAKEDKVFENPKQDKIDKKLKIVLVSVF